MQSEEPKTKPEKEEPKIFMFSHGVHSARSKHEATKIFPIPGWNIDILEVKTMEVIKVPACYFQL